MQKKIADKLRNLKKDDPNFYSSIWDSIAPFIKIGAMEDEKFGEQVEDLIIFKTQREKSYVDTDVIINSENNNYTTIKDYCNRLKDQENKKVIYCTDEISQANPLSLWKGLGTEIIMADTVIDSQFIPWREAKNNTITFQRVDSEIDIKNKDESPELAGKDGENKSDSLKEIIKKSLNNSNVTVQIQKIKGNNLVPAMILLPEQMRRINDMGALMEQKLPGLPANHVLLVNSNHPLVEGLYKLQSSSIIVGTSGNSQNEELIKDISTHLYQMACLSVGGLDPKGIADFQKQNSDLMGKLITKIV